MIEKRVLKESMQKNAEAIFNFIENSDFSGGEEYFRQEVKAYPNFDSAIYLAYFRIWQVYQAEHNFEVKTLRETIDTALELYRINLEAAVTDDPNFKEGDIAEEVVRVLDRLKWMLTFFHKSSVDRCKNEHDDLKRMDYASLCRDLHKLAFEVGDKMEGVFGADVKKDAHLDFWKAGCEMMDLFETSGEWEYKKTYLTRKDRTDRIKQYDPNFPDYELHYIAKTLEEKVEIVKAEKRVKKGTIDQDYPEKRFVIPEGVEVIEQEAINGHTIEEVVIPKSVKRIETKAFYFCKKLTKIIIPADSELECIEKDAFFQANQLQTIKVPKACSIPSNLRVMYISFIDKIIQKIKDAIKK